MAYQLNFQAMSFIANEDLSTDQHKFVELMSTGLVRKPTAVNTASVGILENNPASGQAAAVSYMGVTKVKVNAAYAIGTYLKAHYDAGLTGCGKGIEVSGFTGPARAIQLEASTADNQIVTCRLIDGVPGGFGVPGATGAQGVTGLSGAQGETGVA
jgi:hypothetical protein